MKTILIPTDFSDNARNATLYAFSLFDLSKDRFILLNAFSIPETGGSALFANFADDEKKESTKKLNREKDELIALLGHQAEKLEIVSDMGVLSAVVDYIKDIYLIDYIVMGTKGASGLEGIFIGSNTYDVVKDVACPTIIVPENATFNQLSKVVFAADFSKIDDSVVLDSLTNYLKENDSELHILNVLSCDEDNEFEKKSIEKLILKKYFSEVKNHSFHTVVDKSINEGIDKYVRSVGADMVVMLSREKSFFEDVFQKSVTRKAVLHTRVPVLVLHDRQL